MADLWRSDCRRFRQDRHWALRAHATRKKRLRPEFRPQQKSHDPDSLYLSLELSIGILLLISRPGNGVVDCSGDFGFVYSARLTGMHLCGRLAGARGSVGWSQWVSKFCKSALNVKPWRSYVTARHTQTGRELRGLIAVLSQEMLA